LKILDIKTAIYARRQTVAKVAIYRDVVESRGSPVHDGELLLLIDGGVKEQKLG
jgi:hypothetical protein